MDKIDNKTKQMLFMVLGIVGLIVITGGVTYAFFNYAKEGTTDNTVTTGSITFLYTEVSGVGKGISINDAFPIPDEQGKAQTGEGNVFDFKVTSKTATSTSIPYEVTARKKSDSNLDESAVKLYLTKVTGENEEEVLLDNYNNLTQTSKVDSSKYTEKTIYNGKVPSNSSNYEQSFRLRMWIDENVDFSPNKDGSYPYNNKTFTVTVNVYANGRVLTAEEQALESSVEVESIVVENNTVEVRKIVDETLGYQYEANLENVDTTMIEVNTKNPYAKVTIEKIDSLAYQETSKVKRLSTRKIVNLTEGDNYFKVTVTSEDKKANTSFIIKIHLDINATTVIANSILDALSKDLESGYYNFKVTGENETITYPVHLYVLNGNQTFSENQTFGDSDDVGSSDGYAKRMVIVKVNGNLTINEGVTVEPYYNEYGGPKGFTLYVTGTLTNNGTIDNSHGAKAEGQNVYLWKNSDDSYEFVSKDGAIGGVEFSKSRTGIVVFNGNGGQNGIVSLRQTGGGATGGASFGDCGGTYSIGVKAGGNGTSYSGGTGSGGIDVNAYASYVGYPTNNFAGSGGNGYGYRKSESWASRYAGGGAGNPGGLGNINNANNNSYNGENGTGGLLIIYANRFSNNNLLSAIGKAGGNGRVGGGASGGGSINVFAKQIINAGSIDVSGGSSSGTAAKGGTGGKGTFNIGTIENGDYISK